VRALLLLVVTACGRFGFSDDGAIDAAPVVDGTPDAPAFIAPGVVVRYAMDDDPATGVIGSAELPATCVTCPTATTGVHGGGYLFDGSVRFALPSTTLVGAGPYSVAVWFRLDVAPLPGYGRSMVNKVYSDTLTTDVFNLLVTDQLPSYETTAVAGSTSYVTATAPVNLGDWHHIAGTWDGTTKRLYIDGTLVGSLATTLLDSTEPLAIGADQDMGTTAYPWIGALDDLQFYARALGDAEIAVVSAR
jgi:hypothetical protein